jgi:uncharacterized membrane protein
MSVKKLAIGAVVGAIVLYALGYIFFDILFFGYYEANAGAAGAGLRETQILWASLLGTLAYGVLVTYLVGTQAGALTVVGGLKAGAIAGFLLWCSADFIYYGLLDLWSINVVVLDIVLETVRAAVSGAVVALVLAKVSD